ncbi:replication initiation factor domain-containing protein [Carnobacterium maltaromaticum]|uniref:replication initiation factor domain-containing protein n=1 Tax=Carnobacterium maltaromaticum TaxID=2751 RepID=UPI0039B0EC31
MISDENPRTVTTGVLYTSKNTLRACIDWVEATFQVSDFEHLFDNILGININEFSTDSRGILGYSICYTLADLKILINPNEERMGVHLLISGQGCRQLEKYFESQKRDWKIFFSTCLTYNVSFTRIDVALDDRKPFFKMASLKKKVKKAEIISKFRTCKSIEKIDLSNGFSQGSTLYFGAQSSNQMFRFYEKNFEQAEKLGISAKEIGDWNRYEIVSRKGNADMCALMLATRTDLSFLVRSVLNEYLRVVNSNPLDSNKSRWTTWRPWQQLIDDGEKLSLTMMPKEKIILDSEMWVRKQVAPTLKMLKKAYGDEKANEILFSIIEEATLNHRHIKLLNKYEQENAQNYRLQKKNSIPK